MKLPGKAKPSKVVGDESRPVLADAHLRVEDDHLILYATNSYSFLKLTLDRGHPAEGQPGTVPVMALKHMEKGIAFEARREGIRVGIATYDRKGVEEKFPSFKDLVPNIERPFRVGIDAKLLHELAEAMGAPRGGVVTLEFDLEQREPTGDYRRAIRVRQRSDHVAEGLIMPVRLDI